MTRPMDIAKFSLSKATSIATIASTIIAAIAVWLVYHQIQESRHEARRATAVGLYSEYLKSANSQPKFAHPSYPLNNPTYCGFFLDDASSILPAECQASSKSLKSEDGCSESCTTNLIQYEFYVSALLFSVESILELDGESDWRGTLVDQLKYHAIYLKNNFPSQASHYSARVNHLIGIAISCYEREKVGDTRAAPCPL
jgi:hypothetical protein